MIFYLPFHVKLCSHWHCLEKKYVGKLGAYVTDEETSSHWKKWVVILPHSTKENSWWFDGVYRFWVSKKDPRYDYRDIHFSFFFHFLCQNFQYFYDWGYISSALGWKRIGSPPALALNLFNILKRLALNLILAFKW